VGRLTANDKTWALSIQRAVGVGCDAVCVLVLAFYSTPTETKRVEVGGTRTNRIIAAAHGIHRFSILKQAEDTPAASTGRVAEF